MLSSLNSNTAYLIWLRVTYPYSLAPFQSFLEFVDRESGAKSAYWPVTGSPRSVYWNRGKYPVLMFLSGQGRYKYLKSTWQSCTGKSRSRGGAIKADESRVVATVSIWKYIKGGLLLFVWQLIQSIMLPCFASIHNNKLVYLTSHNNKLVYLTSGESETSRAKERDSTIHMEKD